MNLLLTGKSCQQDWAATSGLPRPTGSIVPTESTNGLVLRSLVRNESRCRGTHRSDVFSRNVTGPFVAWRRGSSPSRSPLPAIRRIDHKNTCVRLSGPDRTCRQLPVIALKRSVEPFQLYRNIPLLRLLAARATFAGGSCYVCWRVEDRMKWLLGPLRLSVSSLFRV